MKKIALAALFLASFYNNAQAQVKMGDNTSTINSGAVLELESTNKGFLIPRVKLLAETNISPFATTPTTSMLVFNNDSTSGMKTGFYYWFAGKWTILSFANSTNSGGGGNSGGSTPFVPNVANGTGAILNSASNSAGNYSLASGHSNQAGGEYSTAMGNKNNVSGKESFAAGNQNTVSTEHATAFGDQNTISNGGKNGTAGGYQNTITGETGTAFGNKNKVEGQYGFASGSETKASGMSSTSTGNLTEASGQYSFASGTQTKATKIGSASFGSSTLASGNYSFAIGSKTIASGESSFAGGSENTTEASGTKSFAFGQNAKAKKEYSVAIGLDVTADGTNSFALGQGASTVHNHTMIMSDGRNFSTTKDNQFMAGFQGGFVFYTTQNNTRGITLDGIEFKSITNGEISLGTSSNRWKEIYSTGTVYGSAFNTSSDKRLKKNIENMNYGLKEVMNLRPVTYNWISGGTENKIGFIAQEMQEIIPEVVIEGNDKNKTMGINYAELVSVLTKAIQEQQAMINELKTEVSALKDVNNNGNTAKK